MGEGSLRSVKIGGRRLILRCDLLAFINAGRSAPFLTPSPVPRRQAEAEESAGWSQSELPLKDPKYAATNPVFEPSAKAVAHTRLQC